MTLQGFNQLSIEQQTSFLGVEGSFLFETENDLHKDIYYKLFDFFIRISFSYTTGLLESITAVDVILPKWVNGTRLNATVR